MRVGIYLTPKSFTNPTGQAKHATNMALCLWRQPGVEAVLFAARDQLAANGQMPPGSPLSGLPVRTIPLPARVLHFLWRTFNWPPVDRWCGKVDWVYSPTEIFVPAKNARTTATIHCVNWFEKQLPWSNTSENLQTRRRMAKVFRPIISHADLICTVSEFLKGRICELLEADPSRIAVVGNGVEDKFLAEGRQSAVSNKPASEPYILSVGALESRKGAEHLLALARHLAQTASNLKLVIGGGRYGDPKCISEAEQMPNVTLTDYIGLDELPRLIKGARALLMLSRYETFGIPVVEAMAVGTPVIAARFAALPEIIGEAGILVDATRPTEVSTALIALDNIEKSEQYRQLGFQRVQQFTWQACASRLLASMEAAAHE
jgi:glycosyltransferase involved in cell wall biosynthesis